MNTLREAAVDYIAMRRNLGYKLKFAGIALTSFVEFMEETGACWITSRLALEWAQKPAHMQPSGWAQRLGYVRGFARYRSAADGRTEIPPSHLLPYRPNRAKPYLYTQKEIQGLLTAALNIPHAHGLGRFTYYCVFGLLAVSGMRISEVLNLSWYPCTIQHWTCCAITSFVGRPFSKDAPLPFSLYQDQAIGYCTGLLKRSFCVCREESGCARLRTSLVRGFTIFDIITSSGLSRVKFDRYPKDNPAETLLGYSSAKTRHYPKSH